jgi:uncharacterized protein (DUF924 family)
MSKDYRSTWEHAYSRAINKARRNNLTKEEMMKKYGRFPKKNEWFGSGTEKEWTENYLKMFPKPE